MEESPTSCIGGAREGLASNSAESAMSAQPSLSAPSTAHRKSAARSPQSSQLSLPRSRMFLGDSRPLPQAISRRRRLEARRTSCSIPRRDVQVSLAGTQKT